MKNGFTYNLIQEIFSHAYSVTTGNDPYPLRTLVRQKLKHAAPGRLLDVGCGSGCYAITDFDYTGIDPNPKYIDYCREHRPGHFEQMRGEKIEFPDQSFDAAICFSVGHHLPDSTLAATLLEIRRVLVSDGFFYFADVTRPITNFRLASRILERLDEGEWFRTEEESLELVSARFTICERHRLVDQFYRTVFLTCRKH